MVANLLKNTKSFDMQDPEPNSLLDNIWASLREAVDQPRHPFRWPVLATSSSEPHPHARVVVLRKIQEYGLYVYTDERSRKVADLRANPHGTLLFFDSANLLQVRIQGKMAIHHADKVADRLWEELPSDRRTEYQGIGHPGEKFSPSAAGADSGLENYHFCVLSLKPSFIDHLHITRGEHLRHQFRKGGGRWTGQRVLP